MNKRVAIGLSGGVDSSVAAALLVDQGYEVMGVYITCWDGPGCRSEEDRQDALDIALQLSVPFVHLDFKSAYKEKVFEYMMSEYEAGRTPNPDVMCNREIKFGLFYEWAMKQGFDFVATGHYAQTDGKRLLCGVDETKDQSYFLYQLRQEQLGHILYPVGSMMKKAVRKEAEKRGLLTAEKPDSQGVCFIGDVSVSDFLEERIEKKQGRILLNDVEVGTHKGVWFYTIGQRIKVSEVKGLKQLGFDTTQLPHFYVIGKDLKKNVLFVGTREMGYQKELRVESAHWINEQTLEFVRIRHGGEMIKISKVKTQKSILLITLEKPVWGVAAGQSAVFYRGDECLGGGILA